MERREPSGLWEDGHRLRAASVRDVKDQPLIAVEKHPIVVVDLHHDRLARDERIVIVATKAQLIPLPSIAVAVVQGALVESRVDAIGPTRR